MITTLRIAVTTLLLACSTVVCAKQLTCTSRGYTLSVPDEWTINEKSCLISGPDQIYVAEINPTGKEEAPRTIELVSAVTTAVLKAGMQYQEYGQRVEVQLPNARGLQRMFKDSAGRNVVQLLLEKDGRYWQLLLQTPMNVWSDQKDALLKVLHTVEIQPSPSPK